MGSRARALATLAYAYGSGNVANWIREGGSLEDLNIPDEKFKTEDLEKIFDKIGTKRQKFLLDVNKKTKGKFFRINEKL